MLISCLWKGMFRAYGKFPGGVSGSGLGEWYILMLAHATSITNITVSTA
jgi:hypothetical protein